MQFPLSWLKEHLFLEDISADAIAQIFTSLGIEVESVQPVTLAFDNVVVARVVAVQAHPSADRLRIATVDDGQQILQIVCGASNCREGISTALARIGASITLSSGEKIHIKKSKLRGVESYGMLCSADELQLVFVSDGIIELDQNIALGTPLNQLYSDYLFHVSVTPNLGHCLSVHGIARELAAALDRKKTQQTPFSIQQSDAAIEDFISITIEEPTLCMQYSMRIIKNVAVAPSPLWLQKRLHDCGLRSINNVVDITNYILFLYGQPLHAFDYGRLQDKQIVVRAAKEQETLVTLDGAARILPPGALLICSGQNPEAIAGVMGGERSAITNETKDIALESAIFHPSSIRKTSKALSIATDASKRFERGVDSAQMLQALDHAAYLIQQIAGGEVARGHLQYIIQETKPRHILCRKEKINQILGLDLSCIQIHQLLSRLELTSTIKEEESFDVCIPTYRNDLKEEIDLIEEIARLYGYDNLPRKETKYATSRIPTAPLYTLMRKVRSTLIGVGLQEIMTCDLISPRQVETLCGADFSSIVSVLNPTSQEQSILRPSLLPGLLQIMQYNKSRGRIEHSAFEVGKIYSKSGAEYQEPTAVALLVSGRKTPFHWQRKESLWDFFSFKGVVEHVLHACCLPACDFIPSAHAFLHPLRQACITIDGQVIGFIGEIHPNIEEESAASQRTLFAQIELEKLAPLQQKQKPMQPLAQFPASERDWTIPLGQNISWQQIERCIGSCRSVLLESFYLRDLYCDEKNMESTKNITVRFVYRSKKHTLSFSEIETEHQNIQEHVLSCLQKVGA